VFKRGAINPPLIPLFQRGTNELDKNDNLPVNNIVSLCKREMREGF
jgi:hypothetical protein